jgi:membrane associated rhomboid family serine protease
MSTARTGDTREKAVCYRHSDRETLLSCSNCERPICTSCMTPAAVGIRCPECAGGGRTAPSPMLGRRARANVREMPVVTVGILVVCVAVFLAEVAQGVGLQGVGSSSIVRDLGVSGPTVAAGEWWRLLSTSVVHAGVVHLAFNMLALWWLGGALERFAGSVRMLVIYVSAVLWGSAGALLLSPDGLTVGASGGVFGLMAALLVIERSHGVALLGGGIGMLLVLNLGITFLIPGISVGGHLGGLIGGGLAALALSGWGRGHLAYGRPTPVVVGSAAAVLVVGAAAGILVV